MDSASTAGNGLVPPNTPQSTEALVASRTDVPSEWDERTMLTTFLDYARATVHAKCAGVTDSDARRAPLPGSPLTTMSSLVSHLRWVECDWFETRLLGYPDHGPWTDADPDGEMRVGLQTPIAQLLEEYAAQCERIRHLVADLDLDTPAKYRMRSGETVTLRWIMFHMIEETARHNGHLDLLREMADGVTGD